MKFTLFLVLWVATAAFAESSLALTNSLTELAPAGYIVVDTVYGDLNKDGQDVVFFMD